MGEEIFLWGLNFPPHSIYEHQNAHCTYQAERLHSFYYSPNVIKIIKSTRMKKAGDEAPMEMRNVYKILVKKS